MTPELRDALVSLDVVDLSVSVQEAGMCDEIVPKVLGLPLQSSNAHCDDGS